MLQLAFDGFARQATTALTSSLRTVCAVTLASIEQRSYAEYVDSLDDLTYLSLFAGEPMRSNGVLDIPLEATMTCLDHMLGGLGARPQPRRALSEIESSVVSGLIERLLNEMRYSLSGIIPLEPRVLSVEYSPQFAQVAGASDVMVVATLELRINDASHAMSVCLPFAGLHPYLVRAAAPAPVSERERAQIANATAQLHHEFDRVPVDVSVRLRPTTVDPNDLAGLTPGTVLRLRHPASAPMEVVVDETLFAHATVGSRGPRLAALIVGTPKET